MKISEMILEEKSIRSFIDGIKNLTSKKSKEASPEVPGYKPPHLSEDTKEQGKSALKKVGEHLAKHGADYGKGAAGVAAVIGAGVGAKKYMDSKKKA
jgi:hypothetical protein